MTLSDILSPERVRCDVESASKKHSLELLSALLAESDSSLTSLSVFDRLLARERLGSTGLDDGVAIPHGRLAEIDRPVGAFVRLVEGVDFDSLDHKPVDLLFGLVVPEESTEEHLQILSQLAELFSDESFREQLRAAPRGEDVVALFTQSVHPD